MTRTERETRDVLRGVGRWLAENAHDPRRDLATIAAQLKAIATLAAAHAAAPASPSPRAAEKPGVRA